MSNAKVIVMSLPVGDVAVGDILVITGEFQATNNSSAWALFSRGAVLASLASSTSGQPVAEVNGENFNPVSDSCWVGRCDVHHLVATKTAIITVTKAMPAAFVSFYALSATSPSKSLSITIDKGYGTISALKIRQ
jgi:hypothetical protein